MSCKWIILVGLGLFGCNAPSDDSDVCPRARPAFDVRLSASDGPLPRDARVAVTFGGSDTESFPTHARRENDVLCCVRGEGDGLSLQPGSCGQPIDADASLPADGGATELIHCQVWSNGAAYVDVEAAGYSGVDEVLVAKADDHYSECAVWDTQAVEISLSRGEAGVLHFP